MISSPLSLQSSYSYLVIQRSIVYVVLSPSLRFYVLCCTIERYVHAIQYYSISPPSSCLTITHIVRMVPMYGMVPYNITQSRRAGIDLCSSYGSSQSYIVLIQTFQRPLFQFQSSLSYCSFPIRGFPDSYGGTREIVDCIYHMML